MRDSGQFNYHLDKVEGHFVSKTDDGYELRPAGRRVIGTVLSGAVTEDPVVEPTPIDEPCPICGAPSMVAFYQERLDHYCTECAGYYGTKTPLTAEATDEKSSGETPEYGYIGSVPFPPAGLQERSPEDMFQAACAWFNLEVFAVANRVCPRCSAPLSESLSVCESHESTEGVCEECHSRYAVLVNFHCTNCLYEQSGAFGLALMATTDVLEFLLAHGINPVSPDSQAAYYAALMDYDEEVISIDPFEARFTFSLDDDTLTLAVDDDFDVVEAP